MCVVKVMNKATLNSTVINVREKFSIQSIKWLLAINRGNHARFYEKISLCICEPASGIIFDEIPGMKDEKIPEAYFNPLTPKVNTNMLS